MLMKELINRWKPFEDKEETAKFSKIVSDALNELRHSDNQLGFCDDGEGVITQKKIDFLNRRWFEALEEIIISDTKELLFEYTAIEFLFQSLFALIAECPKPIRRTILDFFLTEEIYRKKALHLYECKMSTEDHEVLPGEDFTEELEEVRAEYDKFIEFLEVLNYV
jgi:hypothetical protein